MAYSCSGVQRWFTLGLILAGLLGCICSPVNDTFLSNLVGDLPLLPQLRNHFCESVQCFLQLDSFGLDTICRNICQDDEILHGSCETTGSDTCPDPNQRLICRYGDSIVCEYNDGRGICVYSDDTSIAPFCICQPVGEESSAEFTSSSCSSTMSSASPATLKPRSKPTLSAPSPAVPPSTTPLSDGDQPSDLYSISGSVVSVVCIVLGVLLALVSLTTISGIVLFRRRGKLLCLVKNNPKSTNQDKELDVRASRPDLIVDAHGQPTHDAPEYAYADIADQKRAPAKLPHAFSNMKQGRRVQENFQLSTRVKLPVPNSLEYAYAYGHVKRVPADTRPGDCRMYANQ